VRHRADLLEASYGYRAWLRGEDSDEADAAGVEFAEVMALLRVRLRGG